MQASSLEADELNFVKVHLMDWDPPVSPCQPAPPEDWDPRTVSQTVVQKDPHLLHGDDLMPNFAGPAEAPQEAPQVEELPEPLLIRPDELLSEEEVAEPIVEPIAAASAVKYPHAFLTLSEISEHTEIAESTLNATDGSANTQTDVGSTRASAESSSADIAATEVLTISPTMMTGL